LTRPYRRVSELEDDPLFRTDALLDSPEYRQLDYRKGHASAMREKAVMLVSALPFERQVWSTYNACRNRIPATMVSPWAAKARIYDRLTIEIARRVLSGGGNSIDVGAHHGSILKALVKFSPGGSHWAFEPIPGLARQLSKRFPNVTVSQVALSDYTGSTEFYFLPGSPAHSSLLRRTAAESGRTVRQLQVDVRRLDDCIPEETPIAFIKIDVEGTEDHVLRGAARLLDRHKPVVVFECAPAKLGDCVPALESAGLRVSLLADHLAGRRRTLSDLMKAGHDRGEYYYVASSC
jgi:FkbM family methyltransferase